MPTKQAQFITAVAFQAGVILAIILFKAAVLSGGTDIMLRIEPVDPRDMLRGDYITFRYSGLSDISQNTSGESPIGVGGTVYVVLGQSGQYWTAVGVEKTKPGNGAVFLKGKVASDGAGSWSAATPNQRSVAARLHVVYGIEEYFIPEGIGRGFSFAGKAVAARVMVDEQGEAVLKQVYVDGKPFEQVSVMPVAEETALLAARQAEQVAPRAAAPELVETATIADADQVVLLGSSSDQPVPVNMHVVRALKLTPGGGQRTVALRTCNVAGCLPEHGVNVGGGEAVIKIDVEFMNTRAGNTAVFQSREARFRAGGHLSPVLELRRGPSGNWMEDEPSFLLEPLKKYQQSFFVRVPENIQSVQLVYGEDLSRPAFTFEACFSQGCTSGF